MKTRLISALVGLVVLAFVLFFFHTILFVGVIGLISAVAVYELLSATSYVKDRLLLAVSVVISFLVPFMFAQHLRKLIFIVAFLYVAFICLYLLRKHGSLSFLSCTAAITITMLVPSSFSILVFLRDQFPREGLFYLFLVLAGAWLSDTGAYFSGMLFGKHKLSPRISPKKTVEGYIGGLISAILGYLLFGLLFSWLMPVLDPGIQAFQVNYLALSIIAPFCSTAGVLGDLFASVIKRQTGIKDYGHIMPGHGGIMDRFDSILFVSPVLYMMIHYFPIQLVQVV